MAAQPRTRLISHVANKGFEQVTMIVHGAINVPNVDDRFPKAYVTGQSKYTLATQEIGDKPNATIAIDGNNPIWNDIIFVETLDENVDDEELIILLIDEPKNKNLSEYRIPWKWLQPFYQYHFELIMASRNEYNDLKLFVSITRRLNLLSKQDFKYFGLEVFLNQFDIPLADKQSIYAVGRIVPDYNFYRNNVLKQSAAVVETVTVVFPSPSYQSFIPKQFGQDGYPQITLATKDNKIAVWKHNFLFSLQEEKDSMFVDDSCLIIEFYPFRKFTKKSWYIKDILGWVAIKLDQRAYDSLDFQNAKLGLKTENMLVEGDGALIAENNKTLTGEVLIRLLRDKHPKGMLSDNNIQSIPILRSYYTEDNIKNGIEPVYLQSKFSKLDSRLPIIKSDSDRDYLDRDFQRQYIKEVDTKPLEVKVIPNRRQEKVRSNLDNRILSDNRIIELESNQFLDIPQEYRLGLLNLRQPYNSDDVEEWLLYYNRLSNNLLAIIKKMNDEIISLKAHVRSIESYNAQLRAKMGNFEEKKYNLMKLAHLNEIDKAKINEMFVELRTKLAMKTNEASEFKGKLALIESELDKKRLAEIEYKKLINAHKLQSQELQIIQQRLQRALKTEETCRRQEIVIERLENLIHRIMRERPRGYSTDSPKKAYQYDNTKIMQEIGDLKRVSPSNNVKDAPLRAQIDFTNSRIDALENKINLDDFKWDKNDFD